jgi:sucrose-6-phosphate hydrolase SacC (GH32 family)
VALFAGKAVVVKASGMQVILFYDFMNLKQWNYYDHLNRNLVIHFFCFQCLTNDETKTIIEVME